MDSLVLAHSIMNKDTIHFYIKDKSLKKDSMRIHQIFKKQEIRME